ncbi:uracil-DNA glycosylase family protein [Galbibacter mesophilus]|uniref:uracil-DNA glycosylase family protein n=1 Tax=Galbibacter mesophilus TaxID=379069 RepID=UPI00191EFBD9|nr:uracil-DNA glycosylase family protein [Galbibacter mesophilus]MCM5662213.1 uracil-DNA glycosylase family protein [Galbibacter mesophilus]
MKKLLKEIAQCEICKAHLPLGPKPILRVSKNTKILIIGQAPGTKAHESGKDFYDASGKKLRSWLGVDEATFYNTEYIGVMPMGFCYPGKGKTGDLPPRPECKPQWHQNILDELTAVELIILVGQHAQKAYLGKQFQRNLTETVKNYHTFLPKLFPIPHPSPTNRFWLAKNKWFENEVVPMLKTRIQEVLK